MARVVARRPGQAVRQPLEDGAGPRVKMILKYCYNSHRCRLMGRRGQGRRRRRRLAAGPGGPPNRTSHGANQSSSTCTTGPRGRPRRRPVRPWTGRRLRMPPRATPATSRTPPATQALPAAGRRRRRLGLGPPTSTLPTTKLSRRRPPHRKRRQNGRAQRLRFARRPAATALRLARPGAAMAAPSGPKPRRCPPPSSTGSRFRNRRRESPQRRQHRRVSPFFLKTKERYI